MLRWQAWKSWLWLRGKIPINLWNQFDNVIEENGHSKGQQSQDQDNLD